MASASQTSGPTSPVQNPSGIDMKLEVVTLPVSDVDRSKSFYQNLDGGLTPTSSSVTTSEGCNSRHPTRVLDLLREGPRDG